MNGTELQSNATDGTSGGLVLYRVRDAADRLGLSVTQVRRLYRTNQLASSMQGRRRMIRSDVLKAYMDGLPDGTAPAERVA